MRIEKAPKNYLELVQPLPEGVTISPRLSNNVDIWHLFTRSKSGLPGRLEKALQAIPSGGTIWVSWPKKASGITSDVAEDDIRAAALPLGLVDVKVCAIDQTWSGLKLVIRKENRK